MSTFHQENFTEVVGTLGHDGLQAGSNSIVYGLNGDDRLTTTRGHDYVFLIGGQGNDTYEVANHSAITIFDTGGHDTLIARGMGINYPDTYVATIEGKHLIAGDLWSGQQVTIANWQSAQNQIETIVLGTGTYSFAEISNAIRLSPNYLGDLSVNDLIWAEILPHGTTSSDIQQLLNHVAGRENELVQLLSAPPPTPGPTPQPHPEPEPDPEPTPQPSVQTYSFDTQFYLDRNPDVAQAGVDAWYHFSTYGWKEARDPNLWFDTSWYLEQNTDVAAASINPLEHYSLYGWKEGRTSSPFFDGNHYLAWNPDVAAANIDPLEHWVSYGQYEGRGNYANLAQVDALPYEILGTEMWDLLFWGM